MPPRRAYFDYAASTPVDPRVARAMQPYFSKKFGNPGSLHAFGQEAIAAIDGARERIASEVGAQFRQIVFTGSATEANNLVLRGLTQTVRRLTQTAFRESPREVGESLRPRLIVSAIEHESVLETARDLEKGGVEVTCLPVDSRGVVDLAALERSLNERTVLVSIMYANNEVGTVQPIAEVAHIIRNFREELGSKNKELRQNPRSIIHDPSFTLPLLHTDVAQAFQFLDCGVENLGVDFMTLSAHKIYGPKGAGALYCKNQELRSKNYGVSSYTASNTPLIHNSKSLLPILTGGGQEFGLRSGTENVPLIAGFSKAVELAGDARSKETKRLAQLKAKLWKDIKNVLPAAKANGVSDKSLPHAIPNILNVHFPGVDAQYLLTQLDLLGIAASSGSACTARSLEPSYVLTAMGYSPERAKQSVRFSMGRQTTVEDVVRLRKALASCLKP
jgi:cysteine desulfurase